MNQIQRCAAVGCAVVHDIERTSCWFEVCARNSIENQFAGSVNHVLGTDSIGGVIASALHVYLWFGQNSTQMVVYCDESAGFLQQGKEKTINLQRIQFQLNILT